jgi:hypothetical protein
MRINNSIVSTLLAASSATALYGPHVKAAKHVRRSAKPLTIKDVPCAGEAPMFLSEKTRS